MTPESLRLLDDWALWMGATMSAKTIRERTAAVGRLATTADLASCDWRPVARFLGSNPNWSPLTKITYRQHLQAFFRWAVAQGIRSDSPIDSLPRQRGERADPVPIPSDGIDRLLASGIRRRTQAMVLLAATAGLRVHEIAKFAAEDLTGDRLRVQGKGSKTKLLPVHPCLALMAERMPQEGYWFPAYRRVGPQSPATVSITMSQAMRRAGIPGSAHNIRRWYVTYILRNSDHWTARDLARHANLGTLPLYVFPDEDRRRAAVDALPISRVAA